MQAVKSYLKLICQIELHILPNRKVGAAEDDGENHKKVKPSLVCHLLCNRLLGK